MTEQVRCGLTFDSVDDFRVTFERRLSQGQCFVPWPDELDVGRPVALDLVVTGRGKLELSAIVEQPDFDEHGNTGVTVRLSNESTDAVKTLMSQLQGPVDGPEVFASTRIRPKTQTFPRMQVSPEGGIVEPVSAQAQVNEEEEGLLEPGTVVEDRFRIESHLATGGMGEVYRAAHVHLKRPVALKLLRRSLASDPEMWARFRREAELVSQLESPHVVRVFDFGKTADGQPFLAMEYVEGQTLDELVATGPLPPARAVQLLVQVCEGLGEAHAMGVIHRDLKPPNIILGKRRDGSDVVKILDFGIARLTDRTGQPQVADKLTQLGMVVGTPAYLAPEQALADELDVRTDLYALGCVAYELLTGRPPFVAADVSKVVSMHLTATPAPLASLRPELATLPALTDAVLKALAKEKKARFQTVQEFAQALQAAIAPGAVSAAAVASEWSESAQPASSPPHALEVGWGPEPLTLSAIKPKAPTPKPAPVAAQAADDFFSMSAGPSPEAPAVPASAAGLPVLDALRVGRAQLKNSTTRAALAIVEVLGPARGSELLKVATARVLEIGAAWGAVLDSIDDDSIVLLFAADDLPGATGKAALATLSMRESLLEEAARFPSEAVGVRAAIVGGSIPTPEKGPTSGDFVNRARSLVAKVAAGTLLVDRGLLEVLGDAVETKSSHEALEIVGRRTHLRRTAAIMVGRETVLASLDKRVTSLTQGVVAPVVVRGPRGAGRTTIANEMANRARQRGVVVGQVRGVESLRGQSWAALSELICMMCGVSVDQKATKLRGALQALGVAPTLIEGALVVAGVSQIPQTFTPGQGAHVLRSVVRAGAPDRPVLFLFDVLEALDTQSMEVFRELVTRPGPKELTVGFAPPEVQAERLGNVPTLELAPLTQGEVTLVLGAVLEAAPSARLLETLMHVSKGLPGLLLDWLWLLDDRGQLRLRGTLVGLVGEVPTIDDQALPTARLAVMPLEVRRVLEAAALNGDAFDAPAIAVAWPRLSTPVLQAAIGTRLLRQLPSKKWGFAAARYLHAALATPSVERPSMHARIAASLVEQARADASLVDPALIARHFTLAQDGARAASVWKHATEQALASRRLRDAIVAIRGWGGALGLAPRSSSELLRGRVDALSRAAGIAFSLQDAALARGLVDEALVLAKQLGAPTAEFCLSLARVHRSEARRSKAADTLAQAEALAAHGPLMALIEAERGESRELEGDSMGAVTAFEKALGLSEAARELARWHGEVDLTARLQARLAGAYLTRKDIGAARKLYEASLTRWKAAVWPFAEARVLLNLGTLFVHGKDLPSAARHFEAAAQAAGLSGDVMLQARALLQQAKVLKQAGNPAAASVAGEARKLALALAWEEGRTQAESISG